MRLLVPLLLLLVTLPAAGGKKEREWRQGRVTNVSQETLSPTLGGPTPDSSTRAGGGVSTPQVRQTLSIEAGEEIFLVEMVCLEGQEVHLPSDGTVTFALQRKDFYVRDHGGRERKFSITFRGPKPASRPR